MQDLWQVRPHQSSLPNPKLHFSILGTTFSEFHMFSSDVANVNEQSLDLFWWESSPPGFALLIVPTTAPLHAGLWYDAYRDHEMASGRRWSEVITGSSPKAVTASLGRKSSRFDEQGRTCQLCWFAWGWGVSWDTGLSELKTSLGNHKSSKSPYP